VRKRIERLLDGALASARQAGEIVGETSSALGTTEVPQSREHGDLASNLALGMARAERKAPRAIAEILVRHLDDPDRVIDATEIAGPGFINFRLSDRFWHEELATLLADPTLGIERFGSGRRVQVEFVSANPTGPLTVGHGRNAVLGDTIARLLEAVGCNVEREYYFNNAGRQMKVLGESVRARYLELAGKAAAFPEDGYQGAYIGEIARSLLESEGIAALLSADDMGGNTPPLDFSFGVQLVVEAGDVERAREVLDEVISEAALDEAERETE